MQELSDVDLLSVLVGPAMARTLAKQSLAEVFGFSPSSRLKLGEEAATYIAHPALQAAKELLSRCFHEQMRSEDLCVSSPAAVKSFLCTKIGHLEYESFWCLWLDSRNRLIEAGQLFRGTLAQCSVYPREVVKRSLAVNAGAVVFAHNHPSGLPPEPSRADELLTTSLKSALCTIDVRVLDHFVVAGQQATSFAERGLL